ncbi:hypothetical protein [Lentzea albida]|uniref:hypothetical protein n=1 Tax=Lentzea albida TaxID=65499 RepID=UPI0015A56933|nr:hypothetical protein [Lentzea albida]
MTVMGESSASITAPPDKLGCSFRRAQVWRTVFARFFRNTATCGIGSGVISG